MIKNIIFNYFKQSLSYLFIFSKIIETN